MMLIGVLNKYAHYTCKSKVAGLQEQPAVHCRIFLRKELKIRPKTLYLITKKTQFFTKSNE